MEHLDPYQRPPDRIRKIYKDYQKSSIRALDQDSDIIDLTRDLSQAQRKCVRQVSVFQPEHLSDIYNEFVHYGSPHELSTISCMDLQSVRIYEHSSMPGLYIIPSLLPPRIQLTLLSRLLHRDLSNPSHLSNIHTHYHVSYPPNHASFFSLPSSPTSPKLSKKASARTSFPIAIASSDGGIQSFEPFPPRDLTLHKPLPFSSFLSSKLRWFTLGAQYDWTQKTYPSTPAPPFPADLSFLLSRLFSDSAPSSRSEVEQNGGEITYETDTEGEETSSSHVAETWYSMIPQAAIVNIYSAGDTLSVHRDVSEEVGKGLVSMSIGCDGILVLGLENEPSHKSSDGSKFENSACTEAENNCECIVLRLRSGDAVFMTGKSRFAWHGVPKVIEGTSPKFLKDWPAELVCGKRDEEVNEIECSRFENRTGTDDISYPTSKQRDPYAHWKGWMANKRINLNVRQVWD
ncbi:hypothetical protein M501DRAFT_1059133 [Patellaria atrata CBS 101060]|uniref:Alpha-ketoglutarate-dependent dioxygenase AlkB-like domain-containing protein n=1 Tax=Patellaria atrata CBS 101060 TaxID=1346257 RepID=A0A9P4VQC1_9PEZI|nr:hypothetical protein M501DRAFT_1059133 [Patellaria atrata CBS 101060]